VFTHKSQQINYILYYIPFYYDSGQARGLMNQIHYPGKCSVYLITSQVEESTCAPRACRCKRDHKGVFGQMEVDIHIRRYTNKTGYSNFITQTL